MKICDNEADKRRLQMKSFYDAIKFEIVDNSRTITTQIVFFQTTAQVGNAYLVKINLISVLPPPASIHHPVDSPVNRAQDSQANWLEFCGDVC